MSSIPSVRERLQSKHKVTPTGCWEWTGASFTNGYGHMNVSGERLYVHRLSFQEFRGPIPPGLNILHTCDNPPCINPDHLFAGTQLDNMRDCRAKGRNSAPNRSRYGDRSFSHKLTEAQVLQIHELSRSGMPQRLIGERFNVRQGTINYIVTGKTWPHLFNAGAA